MEGDGDVEAPEWIRSRFREEAGDDLRSRRSGEAAEVLAGPVGLRETVEPVAERTELAGRTITAQTTSTIGSSQVLLRADAIFGIVENSTLCLSIDSLGSTDLAGAQEFGRVGDSRPVGCAGPLLWLTATKLYRTPPSQCSGSETSHPRPSYPVSSRESLHVRGGSSAIAPTSVQPRYAPAPALASAGPRSVGFDPATPDSAGARVDPVPHVVVVFEATMRWPVSALIDARNSGCVPEGPPPPTTPHGLYDTAQKGVPPIPLKFSPPTNSISWFKDSELWAATNAEPPSVHAVDAAVELSTTFEGRSVRFSNV